MSIKEGLQSEINSIINEHWRFLNDNYVTIDREYKHRTELKELKAKHIMRKIKDELLAKLGYIAVFFFIQLFFSFGDYKNPYKNIEKVLLVLYQVVSGKSMKEMDEYIPYATFHGIQKKFWYKNKEKLNTEVTKKLECMFSNIKSRLFSAKINNPKGYKGVTLFLDGHDSRIKYENISINNHIKLYSYKLEGTGVRTQFCSDVNGFILYVSPSKYCKDNCDGDMFLKMKLEKKISVYDCLAFDGGYYHYIRKFIENAATIGIDFDDNNFMKPFRKNIGENLTDEQVSFNKEFGSFRSTIETLFANLCNKFLTFNNNTKITRVTNVVDYNLKFKTMSLLYNIHNFVELYSIPVSEVHKQWYSDDFDIKFNDEVSENENLIYHDNNMIKEKEKQAQMISLQNQFLGLDINEVMEEEENYEVEAILDHKHEEGITWYFVRWKNYDGTANSWVSEHDFNTTDIINEYYSRNNDTMIDEDF